MLQHKKILFFLLALAFLPGATGQDLKEQALKRFQFKEYAIAGLNDTLYFYMHQQENALPTKLVVYLQGTTPVPEPFFGVERLEKGFSYTRHFPSDFEQLDGSYAYVIIGLPGVPAVGNTGTTDLDKYHALNSLDYRVYSADAVINFIGTQLFRPDKIIVYGHSEGAPVAAKLGTVNRRITHLGFWGGNALPDFFDFILFERKENIRQRQSDSITAQNIEGYIQLFGEIAADPANTQPSNTSEITAYTHKRWWSYAEPPIHHLLDFDRPLYVQAASEDENAPIESNYLIPLEFIRLGKKNLTFRVCVGCDHGFVLTQTREDRWPLIFREFIAWTESR